ncbi:HEAT repeat domain-containing protein [Paenibacillus sp. YYML68]|uniref:HEAT repeat domain-containing protein n=1 Tax=Paenibacillus sp. YYML68 TaxID=2909250 RepID=UPI00249104BD|nr:HEAT repeat domain-containing protein [Paenibacillus sp. YYML68]
MNDHYQIINDPSQEIYKKLDEHINTFWDWSKTQEQKMEWETNYLDWSLICTITERLFETTDHTDWARRTVNNLLYIIARDNECEIIIGQLTKNPSSFLFLAKEALFYSDYDARWQFAHYLTRILYKCPDAMEVLLRYTEDNVEYVRRRAIEAMKTIN